MTARSGVAAPVPACARCVEERARAGLACGRTLPRAPQAPGAAARTRGWAGALVLCGVLLGAGCGAASSEARLVHLGGLTMGTGYSVKIAHAPKQLDRVALADAIEAVLERIDARMSTYDAHSELSRFNRSASTAWVPISAETRAVIDEALRVGALTGGAFDITVGPLVDLWGFGPGAGPAGVPPAARIAEALARVGYARVHTRRDPPAVRKDEPDLHVDLSGIAKGYAVDRIAQHLERAGVGNYLVDVGGELRARGRNPQGARWRVAVEKPAPGERSAYRILALDGQGVATSGDYRNFFEHGGRRYSHAIDPRTGWPVAHDLASVAVVDASTVRADALATALMVLGPEAGYRLAQRERLAALFIVRGAHGFAAIHTRALEPYIVDE